MFSSKSLALLATVSGLALYSSQAHAATISLTFSGTVTSTPDPGSVSIDVPTGITVGDTFTGAVTYETEDAIDVTGSGSSENVRWYDFPASHTASGIELSFGSTTWRSGPAFSVYLDDSITSTTSGSVRDEVVVTYESPRHQTAASEFPSGGDDNLLFLNFGVFNDAGGDVSSLLTSAELPGEGATGPLTLAPGEEFFSYGAVGSRTGSEVWNIEFEIDPSSISLGGPVEPAPQLMTPGVSSLFGDTSLSTTSDRYFDPERPTVVIVHGWQPGGTYSGAEGSVEFLDEMYAEVQTYHGDDVNVLLYSWSGAFTDGLLGGDLINVSVEPLPYATDASIDLGQKLAGLLGEDYSDNLHIVGHSYGSFVAIGAAAELSYLDIDPSEMHVTVLDAPTGYPLPIVNYVNAANSDWVDYLENYYGNQLTAQGEPIPGAGQNGGYEIYEGHTGVWMDYVDSVGTLGTIPGGLGDFDISGGFYFSAALGLDGGYYNLPGNSFGGISLASIDAALSPVSVSMNSTILGDGISSEIGTASNGYVVYEATVPSMFETLLFDLEFLSIGDGDWLEVQFEGDLLGAFTGELFGTTSRQVYIDLSNYSGQTGSLSFLLVNQGDAPSRARVSNFQFVGLEQTPVSPVPLPAGNVLMLGALGSLLLTRRRAWVRSFAQYLKSWRLGPVRQA